jgi:DNA repair protein RadC
MSEKEKHFAIKDWSQDDQPREKLLHRGRKALTNAELIAILLGSGTRSKSAVELAREILDGADGNLNTLGKQSIAKLMEHKGVGEAKAITLAAATELGRRRKAEMPIKKPVINSSQRAYAVLAPLIADLDHEEFWVLFTNNSLELLFSFHASKGGLTSTVVDVRPIMKKGLELNATHMILAHNHPSGKLKPSNEDLKLTELMRKAGDIMSIKLTDHIIVTENGYYSFKDEGDL